MTEIYLDNNATTHLLPAVQDAIAQAMVANLGNPSSPHFAGDKARRAIEQSREQVALLVHAEPSQIVFTSGATEANNAVIQGIMAQRASTGTPHLVACVTEHSSILGPLEAAAQHGAHVTLLRVDHAGGLPLATLADVIATRPQLVTIQMANSETGRIHPVKDIAALCQSRGVLFHTDASQAVGKMAVDVVDLGVDLLTFTAHKIHGPSGSGALYARIPSRTPVFMHGGQQENGYRGGTQNLLGIIGFGVAAAERSSRGAEVIRAMIAHRDRFEATVLAELGDASINAGVGERLPNTSNVCFHGVDGQALVARLEQRGLYCSQTTACTSRRPEPSYVLRAMGLSEADAYSSVRFSFGELNLAGDADAAAHIVCSEVAQLQSMHERLRLMAKGREINA
jgi:cysteine desulfurase